MPTHESEDSVRGESGEGRDGVRAVPGVRGEPSDRAQVDEAVSREGNRGAGGREPASEVDAARDRGGAGARDGPRTRRAPALGPYKLHVLLRRRFGEQTPSKRTIARILQRANKVRERRKR